MFFIYKNLGGVVMTQEELKKLAKEYQKGLDEVEEVRREFNERFENLNAEEFEVEFSKYLDEILEDAKKHPVKTKKVKK